MPLRGAGLATNRMRGNKGLGTKRHSGEGFREVRGDWGVRKRRKIYPWYCCAIGKGGAKVVDTDRGTKPALRD